MINNIVLISHGPLCEAMKVSLEMVMGKQDNIHTVSLLPDGDNLQFETDLLNTMKNLSGNTLIFADLLGGTPCNVALKNYLSNDSIEIITGMSLPIIMESIFATSNDYSIDVNSIINSGKNSIVDAKAQMRLLMEDSEEE